MIKAIVFDIGNVIWRFKPMYDDLFNRWGGLIGKNYEDFMDQYKKVYQGFETGTYTVGEWFKTLAPDIDIRVVEKNIDDAFGNLSDFKDFFNNDVVVLTQKLKALGYTVGCLSNTENYFYPYLHANISPLFDFSILSWQVKLRKPELEIYKCIFDHGNWKPEEIIFIDDKPENVEAAKSMGINALVYTDFETLKKELQERLSNYV
jgi:putative hydrolase of the HAD superfamily